MNNKPLLSIIVPVYNVEKYLPRCLDSILAQTFTNIEVIAVNDGSPDNCGKILDEYAQKDKRIKVIHKENGGVSSARNTGLDMATGTYIGFVDPDDYINADMYEYMYKKAVEGDYDIVQCGCAVVNEASKCVKKLACDKEKEYTKTDDMLCDFFECIIINSVCNKIFKHDVILNVRFATELRIAEDGMYVHECLLKSNQIAVTSRCCYNYYILNSSVTHSQVSEKVFDNFIVLDNLYELYVHNEYVLKSFNKYSAKFTLDVLLKILIADCFAEKIPELIEKVLELKETILGGNFSKRKKIFTLMLSIAPKTMCKLAGIYFGKRNRKR